MTWFQDLIKNGHSPARSPRTPTSSRSRTASPRSTGTASGRSTRWVEKKGLEWDVAPLPNIGGTKAAWAGSHQFVLPTVRDPDQNKQDAARVFINWISQKSLEWAKGGQVPVRKSVRESAEFKALTHQAALATQIDDVHFTPPVAGIGDAMPEFDKALNLAINGGQDPATVLSAAAEAATKILEANKKKYGG